MSDSKGRWAAGIVAALVALAFIGLGVWLLHEAAQDELQFSRERIGGRQ